eukprot:scaffold114874_cov19-Tisochrysis_lutea.AAC.1
MQVYDTSNAPQPQGPAGVKVKASQCFTKVGMHLFVEGDEELMRGLVAAHVFMGLANSVIKSMSGAYLSECMPWNA